jgi:hypothetical protein
VQTKPTPRKTADANKKSEYQLFVKEHFKRVKKEMGGATHGAVMEEIGRLYREHKAKMAGAVAAGALGGSAEAVAILTLALDEVLLEDEDEDRLLHEC